MNVSRTAESALRSLKRIRIHSCIEEPGGHENGHEGVCIPIPPRQLRSAVEQCLLSSRRHCHRPSRPIPFVQRFAADVWPPWPKTRAEITHDHCGCGHWGLTSIHSARAIFGSMFSWWLGQMITPRDPHARELAERWAASADCNRRSGVCGRYGVGAWPLHNGTLSSPLGFMFPSIVCRSSALQTLLASAIPSAR